MLHAVCAWSSVLLAASLTAPRPPVLSTSAPATALKPRVAPKGTNELRVRIDDQWFDLTKWRAAHPAGDHWIDLYNQRDASEVFHAFHSVDARTRMLPRLPRVADESEVEALDAACAPVTPLQREFRELRDRLEAEGWWKREPLAEATALGLWALAIGAGVTFAWSAVPIVNTLFAALTLASANTMAGWLAHDYVHGKDRFCDVMRPFGGIAAGLSTTWWSNKHNLHHALTNEVGVDEDLMVDPALWLWAPNEETDKPWRKWQHRYVLLPFSLLFHIWRLDSLKVAWERRAEASVRDKELLPLGAHYLLLLAACHGSLPLLLGTVSLSGMITAIIVTVSHQSEELFFEHEPDWVAAQLKSTRDAVTSNPFSEWIWGGMNYQVEHHLFPTMPRSKYPRLTRVLRSWCEERGIEYRVDSELDIIKRNLDMYKGIAEAPIDPDAPAAKPAAA